MKAGATRPSRVVAHPVAGESALNLRFRDVPQIFTATRGALVDLNASRLVAADVVELGDDLRGGGEVDPLKNFRGVAGYGDALHAAHGVVGE